MVSTALVLSILAILLSLIAIRRQRLPTKYEAERRIVSVFEQSNPKMEYPSGDNTYQVIIIIVEPHLGLINLARKYIFGVLPGTTRIGILSVDRVPEKNQLPVNIEIKPLEGGEYIVLSIDSTDPSEVYPRFTETIHALPAGEWEER